MDTLLKVIEEIDFLIAENTSLKERVQELEDKPLDNRRKLSSREVKDIREAYRNGMPQHELADAYGVNPATISRTVRGIYH